MARINIEDSLFADGRFILLSTILGSPETALGKLIFAYRLAQGYYIEGKNIPADIFELSGFESLLKVGLARREEDGGYYIAGSEDQFRWIVSKIENGKKGGRPAKQKDKDLNNLQKPIANQQLTIAKAIDNLQETETEPTKTLLTPTLTLTLTQSKEESRVVANSLSFDEINNLYIRTIARPHKKPSYVTQNPKDVINFIDACNVLKTMEDWEKYFMRVITSDFLMGPKYTVTLGKLLDYNFICKTLNGDYDPSKKHEQVISDEEALSMWELKPDHHDKSVL